MKPESFIHPPEEIELKLALPGADPSSLEKRLARTPVLARRQATHLQLHNVYFDTPGQLLRGKRVALRIRRTGSETQPAWRQTLKTGGAGDSALSQRGEWEAAVPSPRLALKALQATPWMEIDPDGSVFRALTPCFVTIFERTSWTVRKRDGSLVEVSLDIGKIMAGNKSAPLCELELELLAGQPSALFDLARQITRHIAVMPANRSKSERGYALAQDALNAPLQAQPPPLSPDLPLTGAAQRVLREMFCQFTTNLNTLSTSDDPEVLHQARVAWRRFRSACRLFKPVLAADAPPSWQPLEALLAFVGELRDLDVARIETLPPIASAYAAGDTRREEKWLAMTQVLGQATTLRRKAVRYALEAPAVGATLLSIAQWLEALPETMSASDTQAPPKMSLRRWARRRIIHQHGQLKIALKDAASPESQHRIRILAKRMRYAVEALRSLLPRRRAQRWHQQATHLQTSIGVARDVMQAGALLAKLDVDRGLVEFLRGIAAGQTGSALAEHH